MYTNYLYNKMEDFLNALRISVSTENWYAAIMIALSLPDICGSIDIPGKDKSQKRYADWFDIHVGKKYTIISPSGEEIVFMTGNDCYALRCAVLHQGISDTMDQKAHDVVDYFRFHHSKVCHMHNLQQKGRLLIDIPTFCNDIIEGVLEWEGVVATDSDTRRKLAISNLMKLHLPDKLVGNMIMAHIENPFE